MSGEPNDYVPKTFVDGEVLHAKELNDINTQVDANEENIKGLSKYKTEFFVAELTNSNYRTAQDNTPYWTIIVDGMRVFGVNIYEESGSPLIADVHIEFQSTPAVKTTVYIGLNTPPSGILYACLLCADNAKPEQAE